MEVNYLYKICLAVQIYYNIKINFKTVSLYFSTMVTARIISEFAVIMTMSVHYTMGLPAPGQSTCTQVTVEVKQDGQMPFDLQSDVYIIMKLI